jgi:cytochrome P450
MVLAADLDLPKFDYTDTTLRGERFHEEMARLRSAGWLAEGPFGYVVLDREAGEFFLRSRGAIFPGMKIAEIFGVTEGPLYEQMRRNILHVNGADHTRLRALLNPAMAPRAIERYRPVMREFMADLFQRAVAGRTEGVVECEFVEAFAKPYPSRMIATVMGAPLEDAERLHDWSNRIQKQFDAVSMSSERDDIERAVEEFYGYAERLVQARRLSPGDDLISKLIAAEQVGDRLDDAECINLVFNVLVGGVDTTQSQLSQAIRLMAEHPDQWELLRADPGLAPAAVDEVLRHEPITPFTARILTEEMEFRGVSFPEGTIVMVCAFTGNRERDDAPWHLEPNPADPPSEIEAVAARAALPAIAPRGALATIAPVPDGAPAAAATVEPAANGAAESQPLSFDITADRGHMRPLTFGAGPHYCVGANLARAELEEALIFLSEHVSGLSLAGEPEYGSITGIYGLSKLPLRLTL